MTGLNGLATAISPSYGEAAPRENLVIGIVASKSFEDVGFIEQTVRRGLAVHPDAVWVRGETDTVARGIFESIGLDHVALPLNPYWKTGESFDARRTMRDVEMLKCDHLLVFQKPGATSAWTDRAKAGVHKSLRLVEHGEKPKRARKGRTPE